MARRCVAIAATTVAISTAGPAAAFVPTRPASAAVGAPRSSRMGGHLAGAKFERVKTKNGRGSALMSSQGPSDREKEKMDNVRKLQKSFYGTESDEEGKITSSRYPNPVGTHSSMDPLDPSASAASSEEIKSTRTTTTGTGILKSLPLCRLGWTVMPGFRSILQVEQPQYTHMFEKIVAGPKPWLYGHLHLPGGAKNFGREGFGLDYASQASVVGTVMEITDYRRLENGQIALLANALERMVVLEPEQMTPYSIATVQLYPDIEQTQAYEEAASTNLKHLSMYAYYFSSVTPGYSHSNSWEELPGFQHVVAHAATVAEGAQWKNFEFSQTSFETDMTGVSQQSFQMAPFNGTAMNSRYTGNANAATRSSSNPIAESEAGSAKEDAFEAKPSTSKLSDGAATDSTDAVGASESDGDSAPLTIKGPYSNGGGSSGRADRARARRDQDARRKAALQLDALDAAWGTESESESESASVSPVIPADNPLNNPADHVPVPVAPNVAATRAVMMQLSSREPARASPGGSAGAEDQLPGIASWSDLEDNGVLPAGFPLSKKESVDNKDVEDSVLEMEYRIWTEIDTMLRLLNELQPSEDRRPRLPAPQLLGLLPATPPKGGWPLGFYFDRAIAEIMRGESKEFSVAEAGGAFVHAGGYDAYPSIRRAQRLSYFACALFLQYDGGRIMPHQAVLEIPSIHDRLIWVHTQLLGTNEKLRQHIK